MTRREPNGYVAAAELKAQLSRDPAFLARKADRESRLAARVAKWRHADRPIVDDLRAAGVIVETPWDLVNTDKPYPAALRVLIEHLARDGYPDRVVESLGRALAVGAANPYWGVLRRLFLEYQGGPDGKTGLAVAVAGSAAEPQFQELVALLDDPRAQNGRLFFLEPILKLGHSRGRALLKSLRGESELGAEAERLLAEK